MDAVHALQTLIAQTLRFHWYHGGVTRIGSHTTGWRSSPGAGVVQIHDLRTTIELTDREPLYAESGSAIVLDAQTQHCFTSTTATSGVCRYGHLDFHVLGGISVLSLVTVPIVVHGAVAQTVGNACARMLALRASPPPVLITDVVQTTAIGLDLLASLLGSAPVNDRGLMLLAHATRLQPVLSWIDEHLGEEASRESLARLAGLSSSRFHTLFQEVLRRSPMAYLAARRMQRASQLLMTTSQQVQDIAVSVGYEDPFHFSRVFKRATGVSPVRYREQARQWLHGPGVGMP